MAEDHVLDCPVALNVYPVAPVDVGLECAGCDATFELGGAYTYVSVGHPTPSYVGVCLGCGASHLLS